MRIFIYRHDRVWPSVCVTSVNTNCSYKWPTPEVRSTHGDAFLRVCVCVCCYHHPHIRLTTHTHACRGTRRMTNICLHFSDIPINSVTMWSVNCFFFPHLCLNVSVPSMSFWSHSLCLAITLSTVHTLSISVTTQTIDYIIKLFGYDILFNLHQPQHFY